MYKRIIAMTLALLLLFSMSVFAAEQRLTVPVPSLSFSGTTAYCSVRVSDSSSDINVTLTLYRGWSTIASWSGYGRHEVYVSGTAAVKDGLEYRLVASGTIDGFPFSREVTGIC